MKVCIWRRAAFVLVGAVKDGSSKVPSAERSSRLPDPCSALVFAILPSQPLQKQTWRSDCTECKEEAQILPRHCSASPRFGAQKDKNSACIAAWLQQCASSFQVAE